MKPCIWVTWISATLKGCKTKRRHFATSQGSQHVSAMHMHRHKGGNTLKMDNLLKATLVI